MMTHISRGYEKFITYLMRLFKETRVGFLGLVSNVLRELGKEPALGLSLSSEVTSG